MNNKKDIQKREEDTMSATAKNFAYVVKAEDMKKIHAQPAVSKEFLDKCKEVAQKYQKKK